MRTMAAQHHTHPTAPTSSQAPSGPPLALPAFSFPVFPIAWVFPAKVTVKDFYFFRCIYF